MPRPDGRENNALRKMKITTGYTKYAEGSVLIEAGDTRVLCNATVETGVPAFMKDSGKGWVTAEYSMLPRATETRNPRDIHKLNLAGRSAEIQRLIGRALRSVTDLSAIPEISVVVDCDVLQADGGTRTASITGGYIALFLAFKKLVENGRIAKIPLTAQVAAVSAGIVGGEPRLDLCYEEDSSASVDFNMVMTDSGELVELQGTGEERPFTNAELGAMLRLGRQGIKKLCSLQRKYTL